MLSGSCAQRCQHFPQATDPDCTRLQGWQSDQAASKAARGQTLSSVGVSGMAPPSGPQLPVASLLDLSLRWANEQRLEELYQLYLRRTHVMPGPGAHDVRPPGLAVAVHSHYAAAEPELAHRSCR